MGKPNPVVRRETKCMVYHHIQPQAKARNKSYAAPRNSSIQSDATIFLAMRYRSVSKLVRLQLFNLRLFDLPTAVPHSSPSIYPSLHRPSLVASYASSDRPKPLLTSHLHRRCRMHRCRPILTSREQSLAAWNSLPTPVPSTIFRKTG